MSGWDSYRAVYGAELRAAALELDDHGWPVIAESPTTLAVVTGTTLDVLEMPAALGRGVCAYLRAAGAVAPVAATPTGTWWVPVTTGAVLPLELQLTEGVALRTGGAVVLVPPSEVPDGWVHWRVAPTVCGFQVPPADLIVSAAAGIAALRADRDEHPGAQRPAGAVAAGMRS